ncbi:ParB/RepB/Spo0J family partition protein [Roseobacter sp. HKCCA0434]|uniref:ParB/RepB/Spo0J family partition protein n=1 Tax=Roseobacter sp. HKCCA0434 TaxID=3079297 RepID=UPI002905C25B|nr:ParB N-terminal domain-containing protein [Roseobacter sp. HKCCA0434]
MAKRRRLDPAELARGREAVPEGLETKSMPRPGAMPPIARVAGESAGGGERALAMADEAGRLVHAIPTARINVVHLRRDRLMSSPEGMDALKASIREHGQRVPIEVMAIEPTEENFGCPFGLISGWRRLRAIEELAREHPEDARFSTVRAFVRRPETLSEAYVAMVEENEIREDISHYERARVALMAVDAGVFDSVEAAVDALYAAGSKARRSKIRSFVPVVEELGENLLWPQAVGERLGLRLSAAIREGRGRRLSQALETGMFEDAAGQNAALEAALAGRMKRGETPSRDIQRPWTRDVAPGVRLEISSARGGDAIRLAGRSLDAEQKLALAEAVARILKGRE